MCKMKIIINKLVEDNLCQAWIRRENLPKILQNAVSKFSRDYTADGPLSWIIYFIAS